MSFTLAIVGRPNVGKSTLFNRLVGRKLALVDDQPGVTRDLREGDARLFDLRFTVIDTAGLEEVTDDSLQGRMRRLTERAVEMADVCLFLIDGRVGVTPTDEVFADILRKKAPACSLRSTRPRARPATPARWRPIRLGLGEPIRCPPNMARGWTTFTRTEARFEGEFAEREAETRPRSTSTCPKKTPSLRRMRPPIIRPQEAAADRGDRPPECRKVDADQQDPWL
jgi:GTP-binding protein